MRVGGALIGDGQRVGRPRVRQGKDDIGVGRRGIRARDGCLLAAGAAHRADHELQVIAVIRAVGSHADQRVIAEGIRAERLDERIALGDQPV